MDKTTTKPTSICFVAGRSGGHIIPALTLAREYKEKEHAHTIIMTTATELDGAIVAGNPFIDRHIPLALENIPYKHPLRWPGFMVRFLKAFFISWRTLHAQRPSKVISMGGYISLPVCLAARMQKIPVELFELNVEPGEATKFLAPLATVIRTCFAQTSAYLPSRPCTLTAYPLRFTPAELHAAHTQDVNSTEKKIILIVGGSQGSRAINTLIRQWLEQRTHLHNSMRIVHQLGGHEDLADWNTWYQTKGIDADTFTYRHDMAAVYARAAVVICRSGAGTLFEILFFGKPCITIPLETTTNNHQLANAQAMEKNYPALVTVLRQATINQTPELFYDHIEKYLYHR